MDDPRSVSRLSRDNADVVTPNNNHADARTSGVRAFAGPLSRERKPTIRFTEIPRHVCAAPGVRPVRVIMPAV